MVLWLLTHKHYWNTLSFYFLPMHEALMYKEPLRCYSMFIYDYLPSGVWGPLHWWCTGMYVIHSSIEVFPAKEIFFKKQLVSSLLVMCMSLCIWTPQPPHPSSSNYIKIASPLYIWCSNDLLNYTFLSIVVLTWPNNPVYLAPGSLYCFGMMA